MKLLYSLLLLFLPLLAFSQDILEGLVAHYPFSGNAEDVTEYQHHGEVYGATLTEDRFGNPESAYEFNGTDNFIRVEHSELFNFDTSDPYTVSLWVLASETQQELTVPGNDVLSKWFIDGASTQTAGYTLVLRYNNQENENPYVMRAIRFDGYPGGCNHVSDVQEQIIKELWHHIVFSFDGLGSFKFYYDGELVDEEENDNLTCTPQNTSPLLIGKRGAAPHPLHFTGKIDDLRIYERAISLAEVEELFNEAPAASSIKEESKLSEFSVYPNPAITQVQLDLGMIGEEVKSYLITRLDGTEMQKGSYSLNQTITVRSMTSGIYFIHLFDSEGNLIGQEKFIKISPRA